MTVDEMKVCGRTGDDEDGSWLFVTTGGVTAGAAPCNLRAVRSSATHCGTTTAHHTIQARDVLPRSAT